MQDVTVRCPACMHSQEVILIEENELHRCYWCESDLHITQSVDRRIKVRVIHDRTKL
jgi:hypothetical protein